MPTAPRKSLADRAADAQHRAVIAEASTRLKLQKATQDLITRAQRGPVGLGDYRGVKSPRLTGAWVPQITSGDHHLDQATLAKLRGHAQRLHRNHPVARAIVRRTADLAIGTGLSPKANSKNAGWNKQAERLWWRWSQHYADARGRLSFGLLQHLAVQLWLVDGDCGIVSIPTALAGNRSIPAAEGSTEDLLRLQLIEADRIASPQKGSPKAREGTVQGLQLDQLSRASAYFVAPYHASGSGVDLTRGDWINAEHCRLLMSPARASQTRGEPALAALIVLLEQLDKYIEAEVVAAALSACIALVIKTEHPQSSALNPLGADITRDAPYGGTGTASERWQEFKPGLVKHMRPGESTELVNPARPSPQLPEFLRAMVKLIGADVGLPIELLLLDFSDTNFHASRSALGIAWRKIQVIQQIVIEQVCTPAWNRLIASAMASGALDSVDDWDEVEWLTPGRPVIDPQREAQAAALMVDNNFATRAQICAEYGRDFNDIVEARAKEKQQEIKLGVLPASMPGAVISVTADPTDDPEDDLEDPDPAIDPEETL